MKNAYILIFFAILVFLSVWILIISNLDKPEKPSIEILKQVKYSFSVQNKTNKVLNKINLWAYAPVEKNSFQACLNIETDTSHQLFKSENFNQILQFNINELPPFSTQVINIKSDILYHSIPQSIKPGDKNKYLMPEKHIESNHPDIIILAKQLKKTTPFETAKNIYNWVSTNIEYIGYIKNTRGALYALKHKKGDCTEFMSLFIALCRANNILARGIGGYPCSSGNCVLIPNSYHNWAEFYINDIWRLADCQKKIFAQDMDKYVAMRIISDDPANPMKNYNRFRFIGNDIKVKMTH